MRLRVARIAIGALLLLGNEASAQKVIIHNATPPDVLEVLKADLLPQGFKLAEAGSKSALFTLDRGDVVQQSGPVPIVHIVIELQVRYKVKSEGLEVSASEEAVGATGSRSYDFRKPVNSLAELGNLQRLLDKVRVELEARPSLADSAARRDSMPH